MGTYSEVPSVSARTTLLEVRECPNQYKGFSKDLVRIPQFSRFCDAPNRKCGYMRFNDCYVAIRSGTSYTKGFCTFPVNMGLPTALVHFCRPDIRGPYMRGGVGPFWGDIQNLKKCQNLSKNQNPPKVTWIETTVSGGQTNLKEHI